MLTSPKSGTPYASHQLWDHRHLREPSRCGCSGTAVRCRPRACRAACRTATSHGTLAHRFRCAGCSAYVHGWYTATRARHVDCDRHVGCSRPCATRIACHSWHGVMQMSCTTIEGPLPANKEASAARYHESQASQCKLMPDLQCLADPTRTCRLARKSMEISGFAKCPARLRAQTKRASWRARQPPPPPDAGGGQ